MRNKRHTFFFPKFFNFTFWLLLGSGVLFILSSHPMMKVTYDVWPHLAHIDSLVLHPDLADNRFNWYSTWAFIFRLLKVKDFFTYAIIIHRVQFIACCVIIYYTAKLLYNSLISETPYKNKQSIVNSMALSSLLIWFTVIGTNSTFQQAWIMWYSVNYQITLPLLLLAMALAVNLSMSPQNWVNNYLQIILGIILLGIIFVFHAAELVYLIIYIPIYFLSFRRTIFNNIKSISIILIILSSIFIYYYNKYIYRVPEFVSLLASGKFTEILNYLDIFGRYNISGGNRYSANWNELYVLAFASTIPVTYCVVFLKSTILNSNVLFFILASLSFCVIPNFSITAGIASLISYVGIVNRYYFASLIFLMPPLFIFLLFDLRNKIINPLWIIFGTLALIYLVFLYSKIINKNGIYYQNVSSIINSLDQSKVGVDYSADEILTLQKKISFANDRYKNEKYIYCASYRDSYIIAYLFRQSNILFVRREPFTLQECVNYAKSINSIPVQIE